MCFQLQDAESWMGLDEKKKEKNPARPCITDWPQKHRCFWQRSVRPLLHHTLEVQGQQERGIPACFLPASSPFCKPTLASSHWFPNCSQMSVGHHGSALAPTQRLWNPGSHANTWICNIPFSDSFWTGRSHFNQDGQHLHSSLWKVFFKQKNHPDFLLLLSSPTDGPKIPKCTQTITAGSQCSCPKPDKHWKGTVPATCRNAGWAELCK